MPWRLSCHDCDERLHAPTRLRSHARIDLLATKSVKAPVTSLVKAPLTTGTILAEPGVARKPPGSTLALAPTTVLAVPTPGAIDLRDPVAMLVPPSSSPNGDDRCSECQLDDVAEVRCDVCQTSLCGRCDAIVHRLKTFSGHDRKRIVTPATRPTRSPSLDRSQSLAIPKESSRSLPATDTNSSPIERALTARLNDIAVKLHESTASDERRQRQMEEIHADIVGQLDKISQALTTTFVERPQMTTLPSTRIVTAMRATTRSSPTLERLATELNALKRSFERLQALVVERRWASGGRDTRWIDWRAMQAASTTIQFDMERSDVTGVLRPTSSSRCERLAIADVAVRHGRQQLDSECLRLRPVHDIGEDGDDDVAEPSYEYTPSGRPNRRPTSACNLRQVDPRR